MRTETACPSIAASPADPLDDIKADMDSMKDEDAPGFGRPRGDVANCHLGTCRPSGDAEA